MSGDIPAYVNPKIRQREQALSLAHRRIRYLAVFAEHYGIRPWEWDLLDVADALALMDAYDRYAAAMKGQG